MIFDITPENVLLMPDTYKELLVSATFKDVPV